MVNIIRVSLAFAKTRSRLRTQFIRAGGWSASMFQKHVDGLLANVRRRCRHPIAENERALHAVDALSKGEMAELGALMNQPHNSWCDDFEVSRKELDALVGIARKT